VSLASCRVSEPVTAQPVTAQPPATRPVPPGERGSRHGPSRQDGPSRQSASPERAPRPRVSASRLAWLDALRGVAVLFVVFDHLSTHVFSGPRQLITPWFDTGMYGVLVFFLVSGYIVPASLERKGSARRFWVGRFFRLYPMWVFAIVVVIVLAIIGAAGLRGADQDPASSTLAHMLMLQDLLGIGDAVNVLWTLSYEMAFYLLITSLFVVRAHRRSAGFAASFAMAAVALGGILPTEALTGGRLSTLVVVLSTAAAIVAGLAAVLAGRQRMKLAGAVLLAGTVLVLITLNSRAWVWESYAILAWMFTGTVICRAEQGQVSKRTAAVTAGLVLALTAAAAVWHSYPWGIRPGIPTIVAAAVTFAAGMVFWRRRAPRFLAWTGLVSYSAYLLHPLLIDLFFGGPWTREQYSGPEAAAIAVAFIACLLGCCWAAYRYIEAPAQRLGRRLAQWLDGRLGPDTVSPGPVSTR
jgi:peptidoglycan/LPS O-acetylase OafA/YrhL